MPRIFAFLALLAIPVSASGQVPSWIEIPGPGGGDVTVFLETEEGLIFAGSPVGLFRSETGETWDRTGLDGSPHDLAAIAGFLFVSAGDGLLRSDDAGETWMPVSFPGTRPRQLAAEGDSVVFAVADGSVYRSRTDSIDWQAIYHVDHCQIFILRPDGEGALWLGLGTNPIGQACGFRRVDSRTGALLESAPAPGRATDILIQPSGVIYFSTQPTQYENGGIARRSAGGEWTNLGAGADLALHGFSNRIVSGTGGGVVISDDAGTTWRASSLTGLAVRSLLSTASGRLFAGSGTYCAVAVDWVPGACVPGAGLHFSDDLGKTWRPVSGEGLSESFPVRLTTDHHGALVVVDSLSVATTSDEGETWQREGLRDFYSHYSYAHFYTSVVDFGARSNARFILSDDGHLYRLVGDGGWEEWHPVAAFQHPRALYAHPEGPLLVGASAGIYWSESGTGTDFEQVFSGAEVVSFSRAPLGRVVAAADGGSVLTSDDRGETWEVFHISGYSGALVSAAADAEGRLYGATMDGRVFISDTTGDAWQSSDSGIGEVIQMVVPQPGRIIVVSESDGAVISTDHGASFSRMDEGWPHEPIVDAVLDRSGYLYVAHRRGIVRSLEPVGVHREGEISVAPGGLVLRRNYPNPFHPSTTISFELPETEHVKLTVLDPLGRIVQVLLEGPLPAGIHEIPFVSESLASGVYLYRLEVGDRVESRIMTLLK